MSRPCCWARCSSHHGGGGVGGGDPRASVSSRRHRLTASKPASPSGPAGRPSPYELPGRQTHQAAEASYPIYLCSPLLTSLLSPKILFWFSFLFFIPELFPYSSLPASPHVPLSLSRGDSAPGLDLTLWISPCRCHPGPHHPAPTHHFFLIVPLKFRNLPNGHSLPRGSLLFWFSRPVPATQCMLLASKLPRETPSFSVISFLWRPRLGSTW